MEEKLVACANIIPTIDSLFVWDGELKDEKEALLIMKSNTAQNERAEEILAKYHPYDTPCLISLPASDVNSSYFQWLEKQLKSSET